MSMPTTPSNRESVSYSIKVGKSGASIELPDEFWIEGAGEDRVSRRILHVCNELQSALHFVAVSGHSRH